MKGAYSGTDPGSRPCLVWGPSPVLRVNHSWHLSSFTTGATGRKSSRSLISLSRACICGLQGEARAAARGARAELHAALHPAQHLVAGEHLGGLPAGVLQLAERHAGPAQEVLDLAVVVARAQERVVHVPMAVVFAQPQPLGPI